MITENDGAAVYVVPSNFIIKEKNYEPLSTTI